MPYKLYKEGKKFCVKNPETGESKGCSKSKSMAIGHMRALYAAEKLSSVEDEEFNMLGHDGGMYDGEYEDDEEECPCIEAMESAYEAAAHVKMALHAFLDTVEHEGEAVAPGDAEAKKHEPFYQKSKEVVDMLNEVVAKIVEIAGHEAAVYAEKASMPEEDMPEEVPVPADLMIKPEAAVEEAIPANAKEYPWSGPIVFENRYTGDKRIFKNNAISWEAETLPWAFRWQKASTQGHAGAVPVGRVDRIERKPGGQIFGYGVIIPSLNEEAAEYLRLMEAGVAGGVSVDGDSAQFDVQEDAKGQSSIEFSSMRLRSLTGVDIPAFNEARIKLVGDEPVEGSITYTSETVELSVEEEVEAPVVSSKPMKVWKCGSLVASAIPTLPSSEAFFDAKFDGPTPLTVTKDGRVFGHLALFNTCHIGFTGTCVTPPKGSSYKYFHTGEIETAEGDLVQVGHLTFKTGHADMAANPRVAAEHYDNTGAVAADVRAGEDEWGIWVVGALRPSLSDEDLREFRAAPLSGDWRKIAGKLELVGALSVNVPGFPVPRARAMVASGATETLFTYMDEEEVSKFSDYETGLRWDKKEELANKLANFLDKLDDSNKAPDTEIPDSDIPKDLTKKDFQDIAKTITKQQAMDALKDVRALLDDEEESIPERTRKNLEELYNLFVPAKGKKIEAASEDLIEFYNSCHSPKSGKFCPAKGGRIRGASRGGGGGGGGRNRGGRNRNKGGGEDRRVAAVKTYQKYTKSKTSAKRWASAGTLATLVLSSKSAAGLILPIVSPISPLLSNPATLSVLTVASAVKVSKHLRNARSEKSSFNSQIRSINKRESIRRTIRNLEDKERNA